MNFKQKLLIPALAVIFAVQASALPILVGEFKPANAGDATEHVAARNAIDSYNSTHNPDLSRRRRLPGCPGVRSPASIAAGLPHRRDRAAHEDPLAHGDADYTHICAVTGLEVVDLR